MVVVVGTADATVGVTADVAATGVVATEAAAGRADRAGTEALATGWGVEGARTGDRPGTPGSVATVTAG